MKTNFLNRNLRAKVSLSVIVPLLFILGIFTFVENKRHEESLYNNMSILATHSSAVVESNLRHSMLKNDFSEVRSLLDTIGKDENFRVVYVLDTSGEVIFAPDKEGVGTKLENTAPDCQACHQLPAEERPGSIIIKLDDNQRVFRSMNPIENSPACGECHDPDDRILGLLLTDISMDPVEKGLSADLRENIIWWVGGIGITVLIVNFVLSQFVLSRLKILTEAVSGLGQGKSPIPVPETQPDEIGQLAVAFNQMVGQIEAHNQENYNLSESLRQESAQRGVLLRRLITAQEDERSRIARELHDELGQSLSALALRIEAVQQMINSDPEQTENQLISIQDLIKGTIDQMYNLILDLRPSALDDLGLPAALRACADRLLSHSHVEFELETSQLSRRLPPVIETTIYRIFQEALTNVVRHAKATQVGIALASYPDDCFVGTIEDNGVGFELDEIHTLGNSTRGLGLMGIRERVSQLSGDVEIISKPGEGTILYVKIPLSKEAVCE